MPRKYIKRSVRKYSNVEINLAIEAIENGLSVRQAAKDFHVPYTTVRTHATGNVIYERIGRPTKFTNIEEFHLVQAVLALQVGRSFYFFFSRICIYVFYKEVGRICIHQ